MLEARGFERYDPLEHEDPTVDFAQAEAVLGVHGANLADILFCAEGTRVLELTPTDHVFSWWYAQAETLGLDFGHIVCRSVGSRAPGAARRSDRDVHVDLDELRTALDGMGL
jgi:capsular polysaccharide biosynthesis protein